MSDVRALLQQVSDNDPLLFDLKLTEASIKSSPLLFSQITDALLTNTRVNSLDLEEIRLRVPELNHLSTILKNTNTISELKISLHNASQVAPGRLITILQNNFTLTSLVFTETPLKNEFSLQLNQTNIRVALFDIILQNQQLQQCRKGNRKLLSLAERKLSRVPEILFGLSIIEVLDLSNNNLREIPRELFQLVQLKDLDLSNNQIHTIPSFGITNLSKLEILNLQRNLLHEIPFSLSKLPLCHLDLSFNFITSPFVFPKQLFRDQNVSFEVTNRIFNSFYDIVPFSRLYLLGDHNSGSFELAQLLQEFHLLQFSAHTLPSADKNSLLSKIKNDLTCTGPICTNSWYPTITLSSSDAGSDCDVEVQRPTSPLHQIADILTTRRSNSTPDHDKLKFSLKVDNTQEQAQQQFSPRNRLNYSADRVPKRRSRSPRRLLRASTPRTTKMRNSSLFSIARDIIPDSPRKKQYHEKPSLQFHIACNILDPSCVHANQLLTSGTSNRFPIILVFQISGDFRESISCILRILSSLQPTILETSRLLIVGTFKKSFNKRKQIQKKIKKRIQEIFPDLSFYLITIGITSGNRIKKLYSILLQGLNSVKENQEAQGENQEAQGSIPPLGSPFLFHGNFFPSSWLSKYNEYLSRLLEHLQYMREEVRYKTTEQSRMKGSILSWDTFVSLVTEHSIPREESDKVALYLRNLNIIHHYRDYEFSSDELQSDSSKFVFLLPEILPNFYSKIAGAFDSLKHKISPYSALCGVKRELLCTIWRNYSIQLQDVLLAILQDAGQIWNIRDSILILPAAFDPLPLTTNLDELPNWCPKTCENSNYICRCYKKPDMNDFHFCQLFSYFHSFVDTNESRLGKLTLVNIFQYCFEISLSTSSTGDKKQKTREIGFCRISFDYVNNCISLFVHEENNNFRPFFCMLREEMDNLFRRIFLKKSKTFYCYAVCICAECGGRNIISRNSWIPMNEIENAVAAGTAFVYCPVSSLAVRIDLLAPDISLSSLDDMIVPYEELLIQSKVGEGGFATVFYGLHKGKPIAIKQIHSVAPTPSKVKSQSFPEFRREVSLMAGLHHPNVVGLNGLCKKPLCVLTDFCAYGDLYTYIESRRDRSVPLPLKFIVKILMDIALGMNFLHTATPPILHRDLKSPNILLCKISPDEKKLEVQFPQPKHRGVSGGRVIAQVADFGLSLRTGVPVTERVVDNPLWLAPELLSNKPYSFASDVYAFAIIASELLSLSPPYSHITFKFMWELEDEIMKGLRPKLPKNILAPLKILITSCWDEDPEFRPSFSNIITQLKYVEAECSKSGTLKTKNRKKKLRRRKLKNTISEDLPEKEEELEF